MEISVISPVYMAESIIEELVDRISANLNSICDSFEIILVEDGSADNSWKEIQKACKKNSFVKGIKLSRNFGQHYAITAGLEASIGNWVVVMDCDLQDLPEEITKLHAKAKEGFDIVLAQRNNRQDNLFKRISSSFFYKTYAFFTDTKQDASVANFGIYKRSVIDAILAMEDHIRFFPTMVNWVGFKQTKIEVSHGKRKNGKSSYSFKNLFKLATNNIIAFSSKPLRILVRFGFFLSLCSFLGGIFYLYKYFMNEITVLGFTSIILTIIFFSGIIILTLSLVGIYVGKTFEQVKNRPKYIIQDQINCDEK